MFSDGEKQKREEKIRMNEMKIFQVKMRKETVLGQIGRHQRYYMDLKRMLQCALNSVTFTKCGQINFCLSAAQSLFINNSRQGNESK